MDDAREVSSLGKCHRVTRRSLGKKPKLMGLRRNLVGLEARTAAPAPKAALSGLVGL